MTNKGFHHRGSLRLGLPGFQLLTRNSEEPGSDLQFPKKRVRPSSSDDAYAWKRSNITGNAKPLIFPGLRNYLRQVRMEQLQAWVENVTGRMADMNMWLKRIRNFFKLGSMVEGAGAKVAWTLPLLRK